MRRLVWLHLALAALLVPGCGDSSGGPMDSGMGDDGGGGDDASTTDFCDSVREDAPDPDGLMGECCYRASNADRLANPEFRISGVNIESPASLGNMLVGQALADSLDQELFNWLLLIEGADADGPVDITTGLGFRNADSTYRFADGDAPTDGGGDPNRWDPVMDTGTLEGENITTTPASETIVLPVFDEDGETVQLELPLQSLELEMANMSVDRTCIGLRERRSYDTSQGRVRTFITVEDAKMGQIDIPPISNSLCNLVAGMATSEMACDDVPRSEWMFPPDALCESGSCSANTADSEVCDPLSDCNAWLVVGGFSAQGVEIE